MVCVDDCGRQLRQAMPFTHPGPYNTLRLIIKAIVLAVNMPGWPLSNHGSFPSECFMWTI